LSGWIILLQQQENEVRTIEEAACFLLTLEIHKNN